MGDMDLEAARGAYRNLRYAVTCLVRGSGEQASWLRKLRLPADELALQFDDAYRVAWASRERGWLSPLVDQAINEIERLFTELTDARDPSRWDDTVLGTAKTWVRVRELAGQVLAEMPDEPPGA